MAMYVECMGGIWKLSDKAYKKLRRDIKAKVETDLDDYGKLILTDPRRLDDIRQEVEEEDDTE